jgi:hypothetical protein
MAPKTMRSSMPVVVAVFSKLDLKVTTILTLGASQFAPKNSKPDIHQVFLEIAQENTAGCPMNNHIKWTFLTPKEIVEKLAERGISISVPVVSDLLKIHGFKKCKLRKSKTIKDVKDRDEQFKKINMLHSKYMVFWRYNLPLNLLCWDVSRSFFPLKRRRPIFHRCHSRLYRP